jgi:hypothetical protein
MSGGRNSGEKGKIGYLPKTSPTLDHIPKLDSTLVKYPTGT